MKNPYNQPPTTLGKILHAVYGIDNRPYDSVELLWAKVARSLGIRISPEDELETVLARIVAAGGAPPAAPSFPVESNLPDITNLVGLFAFSNLSCLVGVTTLTVTGTTNREGFQFYSCPDLETLSFPNLVSITDFGTVAIGNCPKLTALTMPVLASMGSGQVQLVALGLTSISLPSLATNLSSSIVIAGNAGLTTISFPLLTFPNGSSNSFVDNALSAASVNHILARGVANAGFVSGILALNGGTNAAPTGQGIIDKAILAGRGITVTTN